MPAHPWQLRADVRPLDEAAETWTRVAELMARHGDEIVDAARRATEVWDAAAAESYDQHRRQVLVNLDRFTSLAGQVSLSLRTISSIITSSQKELDQAWTTVAVIPHEVVGESRHLVFHPSEDDDRGKVDRGQLQAEEIRGRLTLSLDQEGTRLRAARAELVDVRSRLTELAGGDFPGGWGGDGQPGGVGTLVAPSTSVPGSAQTGVGALPPIASVSVSVPDLTGLASTGLAPITGAAAGLAARRAAGRRAASSGTPMIGGMAAGAMGARAGSASRQVAGGRAGSRRLATPRLDGPDDGASRGSASAAGAQAARGARAVPRVGDPADRGAQGASPQDADKDAEKEAKRALLEEKRAERAARKAQREAERDPGATHETDLDDDLDEDLEGDRDVPDEDDAERPAAITVVHYAPGEEPGEPRR